MLEEEWNDIADQKQPAKNLKYALLALGYAAMSSLAFYLAIDGFGLGSKLFLIRIMIGVGYVLEIVSAVYAFLACKNAWKSLQTNKNSRNYIALLIGGLLLLGICRQILRWL